MGDPSQLAFHVTTTTTTNTNTTTTTTTTRKEEGQHGGDETTTTTTRKEESQHGGGGGGGGGGGDETTDRRVTTVRSNGKVGLWGTSWSACSSFVVAGLKARDSRLDALKTIIPVHCGVDLYKGDIHYLDGIMHLDEYILSVDHETVLPSYGYPYPETLKP